MTNTTTNLQTINFENGIASVKSGMYVDEARLRETTVYAKLMLAKGTKLADKKFQYSESGTHIRATAFLINSRNVAVEVDKLFVNIDPTKSKLFKNEHSYYVELIHPQFNVGTVEEF